MKIPASVLASLLLLGCLASGAAGASDYEIRLTRPTAVGQRYHVVSSGSDEQSMTLRVDGQEAPARSERLAVEFNADCEVLAITATGREARVQFTIEKLVRAGAGAGAEILPPGTIVVGERSGDKTSFTVGGSPAPALVAKALDTVGVSVSGDAHATDDVIFGTTERKKVGDSWPINSAVAAADLAKSGIPATAGNLTGTTTFVEVTQANDLPVLRLSVAMSMQGVNPPMPPGVVVSKSDFKVSLSGLFPLDATKPRPQESATMSFEVAASGMKDGKSLEMTMTKKTSREAKFTAR